MIKKKETEKYLRLLSHKIIVTKCEVKFLIPRLKFKK
jgi:hypothetical protein